MDEFLFNGRDLIQFQARSSVFRIKIYSHLRTALGASLKGLLPLAMPPNAFFLENFSLCALNTKGAHKVSAKLLCACGQAQ